MARTTSSPVIAAAEQFLAAGGRLMISPHGRLEPAMDAGLLCVDSVVASGRKSIAADLMKVVGRRGSALRLKNIVRRHGRLVNGWRVLEATSADSTRGARWAALKAVYDAAKAAEDAYDAVHITPFIDQTLPVGTERCASIDAIRPEVWTEAERLQELRHDAEEPLMAYPSPDVAAFALKYLIAHGGGRDTDCWDGMLEDEANRLAGGC